MVLCCGASCSVALGHLRGGVRAVCEYGAASVCAAQRLGACGRAVAGSHSRCSAYVFVVLYVSVSQCRRAILLSGTVVTLVCNAALSSVGRGAHERGVLSNSLVCTAELWRYSVRVCAASMRAAAVRRCGWALCQEGPPAGSAWSCLLMLLLVSA